jgi:hypothetical protein
MSVDVTQIAVVRRVRPNAYAEGQELGIVRSGRYGEQMAMSLGLTGKHALADEGSYFVATNPTPGTAIAFPVNAAYDVTKNLFVIKNNDIVTNPMPKRLYLDTIKVIPTVVPAAATSAHFSLVVDSAARYTSGGTLAVPVNVNGDDGTVSVAQIYYATTTVITSPAAGSSARLVARGMLRSTIPVLFDEMIIQCGTVDASAGVGSTAGRIVTTTAPIILGPQQSAVLTVWFPSNAVTGLSYEFEMGWAER